MFSKSCAYAIRAVLFLAIHATEEQKTGVKEIAVALKVPQHFLGKILQQLSRHNLIVSVKGPHGGFYMSAENLKSPLLTVIECMDGPVLEGCILCLPHCSSENPCPLHQEYLSFKAGLEKLVAHQTIETLAVEIKEGRGKI